MARERRRWTTTLAEPVPPGPAGQPGHPAGAEIAVIHLVVLPETGAVSMTVPRPSAMLLELAEPHVKRGVRLRAQLPRQIKRGKWIQPGFELGFSNEPLVYDFLQEAMGSVLLLHTALDNYVNESLPADFTMSHGDQTVDRSQVEGFWGLPKRLTVVLPAISGLESIETARPELWDGLNRLKDLRDGIGQLHREDAYTGPEDDPAGSIFSKLLAADLSRLLAVVEMAMEYYEKLG
jgi:hypothetical protein